MKEAHAVNLTTRRVVRVFNSKNARLRWFEEFITPTSCSPKLVSLLAEKCAKFTLLTKEGPVELSADEFLLLMGCAEDE